MVGPAGAAAPKKSQAQSTTMKQLTFPQPNQPTITERFNQDQLSQLLARPDVISAIQKQKLVGNELAFRARGTLQAQLQAYQRKGRRGLKYFYGKRSRSGRMYVSGTGMQNLRNMVRQILLPEGIHDYDFENSAPTCLSQLCAMMSQPCPVLDRYIQAREEHLTRLPYLRGEAKQMVISLIFGAALPAEARSTWLSELHKECITIRNTVCEHFSQIYKICRTKENPKASATCRILFEIENMCLTALREYAGLQKLPVRSLIFDGLLVQGQMDCEAASAHIKKKTGFTLGVTEKPLLRKTVSKTALSLGLPASLDPVEASQQQDTTNVFLPDGAFLGIDSKYISCEAGMMMGKTEQTMKLVKLFVQQGKKVLFITQRISMASALSERLVKEGLTKPDDGSPVFMNYDEHRGQLGGHVICEYESIHRLSTTYDLVVMDEFRSCIETVQSSTNGMKTLHHWDQLKNLTLRAEKVLFLCADMSFDGAANAVLQMLVQHEAAVNSDALLQAAGSMQLDLRDYDEQKRQKDAMVKEAYNLKMNPQVVHRIVSKVHKLKRCNVLTDQYSALGRAGALLQEGKRIVLCCASINAAGMYASYLSGIVDSEQIGLYTSKTDNKADVKTLQACWDRYQCIIFTSTITTGADYNTPIDSVFLFPAIKTCSPRDMCQMVGRVHQLTSGNIYISVDPGEIVEACSSADISKAFDKEIEKLCTCTVTLGDVLQSTASELKHTLAPEVLNRSYRRTPHDLLVIGAYSAAENSFCNMKSWMAVYMYMSQKKGYSVKNCDWHEDATFIEEHFKQYRKDLAATQDRLMDRMAVDLFREDHEAFRQLTKLVSGQRLAKKDHLQLQEKCQQWDCELPSARAELQLFMNKATVGRMFNNKELLPRKFVKAVMTHMQALHLHDMHEHFKDDTARLADFMLTMQRHDVPELRTPHVVPMYMQVQELLLAMGFTGLHDRETALDVTSPRYNKTRVTAAVRHLVSLGVVPQDGESDHDMALKLLHMSAGLKLMEGDKLVVDAPVRALMDEKPPCSTAWFDDKWGYPPPAKDQFSPSTADDVQGLNALLSQYAAFTGDLFDDLRSEVRSRLATVLVENSRKRRAPQEAEWNKRLRTSVPISRARLVPQRRPQSKRRRTIRSITITSSSNLDAEREQWFAAAETKREAAAAAAMVRTKEYTDSASKGSEVRLLAAQFFPDNRAMRTHFQKACGVFS
jgi:hypothetical protein